MKLQDKIDFMLEKIDQDIKFYKKNKKIQEYNLSIKMKNNILNNIFTQQELHNYYEFV